jgi:arylsulfatase A-like enzyme
MEQPENIIFVVADSLRYDSMWSEDPDEAGLPYTTRHSTGFHQVRSSGSWTLPATSSFFTGKMPHEHGATTQTRMIAESMPTMAERMEDLGYATVQVTANPVTTDIFGLDRGFDRMERVWKHAGRRHGSIDTLLALLAKARVRRKIFTQTEDFVMGKMTDDVEAASAWMQSNAEFQFDLTRQIVDEYNRRGKPVFVFVNLMETHFPYHIDDTFKVSRDELIEQARELWSLFHYVNQTRLISEKEYVAPDMLQQLRIRQQKAWNRLAPKIDGFVREMHEDSGNMVVFCSDHGDNHGDQNWQYHFSNVTDAGNRVPLYILEPGQTSGEKVEERVSLRDLYGTLLSAAGAGTEKDSEEHVPPDYDEPSVDLLDDPARSESLLESYWYNRDGKTLDKYRFNQFAFIDGNEKFIRRNDEWLTSEIANGKMESQFKPLASDVNPIEEVDIPEERRSLLREHFDAYEVFSKNVLRFKQG